MPERQRTDAVGVANGEDALAGQDHQRVGAPHLGEGLGDRGRERRRLRAGDQVQDDLGVGGRREEGALRFQGRPDLPGVDEVAVVREGERAAARREDDGLGVEQQRGAGRRVADVADGRAARQPREPGLVEDVGDVAHLPLDVDLALRRARRCRPTPGRGAGGRRGRGRRGWRRLPSRRHRRRRTRRGSRPGRAIGRRILTSGRTPLLPGAPPSRAAPARARDELTSQSEYLREAPHSIRKAASCFEGTSR